MTATPDLPLHRRGRPRPVRSVVVVSTLLATFAFTSPSGCDIVDFAPPPFEYLSAEVEPQEVILAIRNCGQEEIEWVEASFTLHDPTGAPVPAFGRNYFTVRSSCAVGRGAVLRLRVSLSAIGVSPGADADTASEAAQASGVSAASVGLFFVRRVQLSDGSWWINAGGYRHQEDE